MDELTSELVGRVQLLTFSREESLNAFNNALYRSVAHALQAAANAAFVVPNASAIPNTPMDKVIRRELAIAPGDVFDMVHVKISKQRLEGLNYFEKVEMDPAPLDPPVPGRKNLDIDVTEKNTGNLTFGAGFSSVDSLVGYVEMTQGNFDLFHPPNFTGGGQKLRLKAQLGTQRQDYELSFIEPWFLNRKLSLGVDLYRHQLNFESPNNMYDESRSGLRLSLTRALWSDFFIGSVSYTLEQVGISLNSPYNKNQYLGGPQVPPVIDPNSGKAEVPQAILNETGAHLFNRREEAVELREHALALFDAEFKPCQMGDAADVLGSQCHGRKSFENEI